MKRKLSERDATRYYEQSDYEAERDVARSQPDSSSVNLTGGKQKSKQTS